MRDDDEVKSFATFDPPRWVIVLAAVGLMCLAAHMASEAVRLIIASFHS